MTEKQDESVLVNMVEGERFQREICKAMTDIKDNLKSYNGPFAAYAATVGQTQTTTLEEFTKDGITILGRLTTGSPQHEICRRLIEFVGKRVDNRCHDGTTTSMMFAAAVSAAWTKVLSSLTRRERRNALKDVNKIIEILENAIGKYSFSISGLNKELKTVDNDSVREKILHDTILTSSKGDTELADKLTEVLMSLPEELYGYTTFQHSALESEERYQVRTDEADIVLEGSYQGNRALVSGNKYMRSGFDMEEADLVIAPEVLTDGSAAVNYLLSWMHNTILPTFERHVVKDPETGIERLEETIIEAEQQLERPLIILSANSSQSQLVEAVNIYNTRQEDWNKKIFLFQYNGKTADSYPAIADVITTMAGDEDHEYFTLLVAASKGDIRKAFIPCSFKHFGSAIEIGNLYPRSDKKFHPYYYDKSKKRFHGLLNEMTEAIERAKSCQTTISPKMEAYICELVYLQRAMVCQQTKSLYISATIHEMLANSSVATDALGAAMSVLEEGIILSGYQKMHHALKYAPTKDFISSAAKELKAVTLTALKEVVAAVYDLDMEKDKHALDHVLTLPAGKGNKYIFTDATDFVETGSKENFKYKSLIKNIKEDNLKSAILQPAAGYKEQLLRIKDIVPKLIVTYSILTSKQPRQ